MQIISSTRKVLSGLLIVLLGAAGATAGETSQEKFYRGYYLEQANGDWEGAAKLFEQVVADGRVDDELRSYAQTHLTMCREELACADFAALMPRTTLLYAELNHPGDQVTALLGQLGLLSDGEPAGPKQLAISPELAKVALGIRGAALAITGFDPLSQAPAGVLVFHPGDLELIRDILRTGLPVGGTVVDPIGGFETYDIEGEALVTLTSRLVVVSQQRASIEDVVRRLKGDVGDSLATHPELAESLEGRNDTLLYVCAHAKPIMPMVNAMMAGAATQNRDLAMAQAVLDLDSLKSFVGRVGIGEDGPFLDLQLRLEDGHRNLVFNLLRTPPIDRNSLKCIPEGAAGFLVGALNSASRHVPAAPGDSAQIVTALDFGREIFANIIGFAVFALPPEDEVTSGVPIPDIAAAITVNDPSKSEALWTQVLGIASLASGIGAVEGASQEIEGVAVRSYQYPDHVALFFATMDHEVLIASSRSAIARAIRAQRTGRSILQDPAFADSLARLSPDSTKAVFVHPARAIQIAKQFMPAAEFAELNPVAQVMADTVVSAVVEHSSGLYRLSAAVAGVPDVGELIAMQLMKEERARVAKNHLESTIQRHDWDAAVAAIDEMLAEDPGCTDLIRKKFRVLAVGKKDHEAAKICGAELLEVAGDNPNFLNNFAWALLTEDKYGGQYGKLALKMAKRANKLTDQKNWMFVDTLALANFETGHVEEAIELENKAIGLSGGAGVKEMKVALARFEEALKQDKK